MADRHFPSLSIKSSKRSEKEDAKGLFLDESTNCIPIISNTILVKNCEVKVLGDSFIWSEFSEEELIDTITVEGSAGKLTPQPTETCEVYEALRMIDSEMIDLDDFGSDSSSAWVEVTAEEVLEPSTLPATLRLLEEVSYRILGEKSASIPKIEKVEINPVVSEFSEEEEDDEIEVADELKGEGEEEKEEEEEASSIGSDEYENYVLYSERFVDSILQSAKQVCKVKHDKKFATVTFDEEYKPLNIIWPAIEQFSVDVGIENINKYIHYTFSLEEAWKHKVTFLIAQSDKVSDFYLYEAKFCIPTFSYPISQATVSLFFTYEVSRVVPQDLPVRVTFTVESLRRVMAPGEVEVTDEMLLRVLYSKLAVFKDFDF